MAPATRNRGGSKNSTNEATNKLSATNQLTKTGLSHSQSTNSLVPNEVSSPNTLNNSYIAMVSDSEDLKNTELDVTIHLRNKLAQTEFELMELREQKMNLANELESLEDKLAGKQLIIDNLHATIEKLTISLSNKQIVVNANTQTDLVISCEESTQSDLEMEIKDNVISNTIHQVGVDNGSQMKNLHIPVAVSSPGSSVRNLPRSNGLNQENLYAIMELYCEHHDSVFNDDDTFLLDDENTTAKQLECLKCSGSRTEKNENYSSVIQIEGKTWIQNKNGVITGMCCNERLNVNSDNLDSPEDSPLLTSIAELIGGYLAGSLAVMTDAAHLFSDLIGFFISIISIWIGRKPPSYKMTFGYHRAEVLGAFLSYVFSVMVIWILAGTFSILAVGRLIKGEYEIDANTMLIISSLGLLINLIMGVVLHGGLNHNHGHSHSSHLHSHEENINVRAAAAHIIGDIVQSAGVLLTALILKFAPEAKVLDPICTIVFAVIVVCATLTVAKDSFLILLESSHMHVGELIFTLRNINGVKHVHSVRSWRLAPGKNVVAAHLAVGMYIYVF
ncbi:cation efflux protein/ zinc transporter [Holotrichia oblita]|uniref:Cation efflux protein/ zinc transporter n=1 Tax=Holotrichia oblita TaxID=644536 RepID=A0ACB9TP16_HOLOL|nr:cation efflux protein/ zinc transporter [Holotrichia oblita]